MKLIISALALLCISYFSNAQTGPLNQDFIARKCYQTKISLDAGYASKISDLKLPFSAFEVFDCREDTSRIGFNSIAGGHSEISFSHPVSTEISGHLQKAYGDPEAGSALVIVIRDLWMYDEQMHQYKTQSRPETSSRDAKFIFRAEAYIKIEEGYALVAEMDTVCSSDQPASTHAYFRFTTILYAFMNKIADMHASRMTGQKSNMSYNDITSFNYKRALYKIDTASALKKGIYANLQEFRNNNPSIITGYTVEKGDDDLVQLYLENEDGKPYLSRKCWGYSDGQQCYIMFDGFLFPVLHAGRSFYVWGSKEYNVKNKKS